MLVAQACKNASTSQKWGKLVFGIIKEFKPSVCLELGTLLGISALYQLSALKLNSKGQLTTIEGTKQIAELAIQSINKLEYQNFNVIHGRFDEVLPELLPKMRPIDFVFIDGHHEELATQKYFETILPYLSDQSIVIFDDINWSKGMQNAWQKIQLNSKIRLSLDLYKWGICLIDKNVEIDALKHVKISL